jgi:hypothetical protein
MKTFELQSYNKKDLSISLAASNLYSIPLIIIPFIIFGVPYYLIWGEENLRANRIDAISLAVIIIVFICGAVIHELIHGVYWVKLGRKDWSTIKFGFNLKTLTPFVHCLEPINARAYRLGTAAPGFILGIMPSILSIILGNVWIFWFGMLFTIAAGGDFLILWTLRKVGSYTLVEDHPARAGCFIYENKNSL